MYFDPVDYLPYELVTLIFGHLSPKDLLSASGVSRGWREHSQDEELWRSMFTREGWHMDIPKIRDFERRAREKGGRIEKRRSKGKGSSLQRRDSRKRRAGEAFSEGEASAHPADANGAPSADSSAEESSNDQMEGVELETDFVAGDRTASSIRESSWIASASEAVQKSKSRRSSFLSGMSTDVANHTSGNDFKLAPTILQGNAAGQSREGNKVSWAYMYKQRRRLEKNWDDGKYQMFRLPHPQHPEEGHDECVYTIQHSGEWLVSGSRDKSIRVWDLTTSRLRKNAAPILKGHVASVLCLQFDATPENDIIVSGGSDSWVIIWRFSTGEIIKKMTTAHTESVLNLRFDHRYIVTCSKDKTIKVWNRHAIANDSPLVPSHVMGQFDNLGEGDLIKEHTLLATLTGHGAAVNAVMIHKDTIVSASGDRTIRAWDIQTGKCNKQYLGHTKGIACVQYDGRRIISGSSDNTVRIFDAERQAEVACLTGHSNLVRTVQARFGDLETVTDEELYDESREADQAFYDAMAAGMKPASVSKDVSRNAGSRKPEHMLSTGTKIPPGGGGSRWAKIVSGSYDETIIIWKKDKDGRWVHNHRLHQDLLLRGTGRHRRDPAAAAASTLHTGIPVPMNHHAITLQNAGQAGPSQPSGIALQALNQANSMAHQLDAALHQGQQDPQAPIMTATQLMSVSAQQRHLQANLHSLQNSTRQTQTQGESASAAAEPSSSAAGPSSTAATTATAPIPIPSTTQNQHPPVLQPGGPSTAPTTTNHAQAHANAHAHAHAHGPHHHAAAGGGAHHRESSNRVFKLQFDARRIVCCSQNRIIVGWDFANGDPDLMRVGAWSVETC